MRIPIEFIREEFEDIRKYFRKSLKIKEVHVTADILIKAETPSVVSASSPEIEQINPALISEVKVKYIKKELFHEQRKDEILTVDYLFTTKENKKKPSLTYRMANLFRN